MDVRVTIAAARRILYREGCDSGVAGHVSVRDGDSFWISPFEYFDETVPERVSRVGFDLVAMDGDVEVSPAIAFHPAIYRRRPDVGAIVHTHSHYVEVLATAGEPVGMYNELSTIFDGAQAFFSDEASTALSAMVDGDAMATALGDKRVLILRHHGAVFAAPTVEDATIDAIAFEKAARLHVEARSIGGVEMSPAHVAAAKPAYDEYFRRGMWEAHLRRLRIAEPSLFAPTDRKGS